MRKQLVLTVAIIILFIGLQNISIALALVPSRSSENVYSLDTYETRVSIAEKYIQRPPEDKVLIRRYLELSWDMLSYGHIQQGKELADLVVKAIPVANRKANAQYLYALVLKAWAQLEHGNVSEAQTEFFELEKLISASNAKRIRGLLPLAQLGLAQCLELKKNYRAANTVLETAKSYENIPPLNWLAFLTENSKNYRKSGNNIRARDELREFASKLLNMRTPIITPEAINLSYQWAELLLLEKNYAEALAATEFGLLHGEQIFGKTHPLHFYGTSLNLRAQLEIYKNRSLKGKKVELLFEKSLINAKNLLAYNGKTFSSSIRKQSPLLDKNVFGNFLTLASMINERRNLTRLEGQVSVEAISELSHNSLSNIGRQINSRFEQLNPKIANLNGQLRDISQKLHRVSTGLAKKLRLKKLEKKEYLEEIQNLSFKKEELEREIEREIERERDGTQSKSFKLSSQQHVEHVDLQKALGNNTSVLMYGVGVQSVFAIGLNSKKIIVRNLEVSPVRLRQLIFSLRDQILETKPVERKPFFLENLKYDAFVNMYQILFGKLASVVENSQNIYLQKDDALHSLPFSVLLKRKPSIPNDPKAWSWLIHDHVFRNLPVLSVNAVKENQVGSSAKKQIFGIGAPDFGDLAARDRRIKSSIKDDPFRSTDLAPLFGAEQELRKAAALFPASQSKFLIGSEATEGRLRSEQLSQYKLLLFSTHAVMPAEHEGVEEASIMLTPGNSKSEKDDGKLNASDLFQLKLNADWVLLSACNTAVQTDPGSAGVGELVQGALFAGTRGLLASHWPVNDNATSILLQHALQDYARGKDFADALTTRAKEISNGDHGKEIAHPLYWAPFSIYGG